MRITLAQSKERKEILIYFFCPGKSSYQADWRTGYQKKTYALTKTEKLSLTTIFFLLFSEAVLHNFGECF